MGKRSPLRCFLNGDKAEPLKIILSPCLWMNEWIFIFQIISYTKTQMYIVRRALSVQEGKSWWPALMLLVWLCLHFFQTAISLWKKLSECPKFCDFSRWKYSPFFHSGINPNNKKMGFWDQISKYQKLLSGIWSKEDFFKIIIWDWS